MRLRASSTPQISRGYTPLKGREKEVRIMGEERRDKTGKGERREEGIRDFANNNPLTQITLVSPLCLSMHL